MNGQEVNRLAALRRYDILDTPPDGAFDRLTSIAARLFNVPIAIVSLVDEDRIWFKSHHGLETQQIPRSPGLCASAIMSDGPYVLEDARSDPHALSNPLVAGDFGLRFYCGVPLTTPDGYGLGTLCVIDREPREVTPDELIILKDLAGIVIDEMELRRSTLHSIAELESAAETREMLLREVHHRVKNNLQMIASMVSLRGRSAAHIPQVASQFREIQIRIQNLSKLHELVYASEDGASIDLCSYLMSAAETAIQTYQLYDRVAAHCTGTGVLIGLDQGVPLSLAMAEVLSNICNHAFPDDRRGNVVLSATSDLRVVTITVSDDGIGIREGVRGHGFRLIELLTRQLRGESSISRASPSGGTRISLRFPCAQD